MLFVDSAPSGCPSTRGSGSATSSTRGAAAGRRATLPGVETKDTRWPRDASRSASSRHGSRWPNASHGKITMRSGRWQSAAWTEQAAELDGDAAGGAGGGQS